MELDLDFYKGKKILITGFTGYLGSVLTKILSETDCELVLSSPLKTGRASMPSISRAKIREVEGNVSFPELWSEIIPGIDVVFHLAAFEHRRGSEFNPDLDLAVNTAAVLYLLETCRKGNFSPKIIFASSSNLFGLAKTMPVNEDFPDDPLTLYAVHKLAAEKYLQYYFREYAIPSVILRLGNVYGPSTSRDLSQRATLNKIINRGITDGRLTLFKNQNCLRDYIFVDDVVGAFLAAGSCPAAKDGRYYVVGSEEGQSIAQTVNLIADRIAAKTKKWPVIDEDATATIQAVEWRNFIADSRRFKELSGWSPTVALSEGIDRTVDYFLLNK